MKINSFNRWHLALVAILAVITPWLISRMLKQAPITLVSRGPGYFIADRHFVILACLIVVWLLLLATISAKNKWVEGLLVALIGITFFTVANTLENQVYTPTQLYIASFKTSRFSDAILVANEQQQSTHDLVANYTETYLVDRQLLHDQKAIDYRAQSLSTHPPGILLFLRTLFNNANHSSAEAQRADKDYGDIFYSIGYDMNLIVAFMAAIMAVAVALISRSRLLGVLAGSATLGVVVFYSFPYFTDYLTAILTLLFVLLLYQARNSFDYLAAGCVAALNLFTNYGIAIVMILAVVIYSITNREVWRQNRYFLIWMLMPVLIMIGWYYYHGFDYLKGFFLVAINLYRDNNRYYPYQTSLQINTREVPFFFSYLNLALSGGAIALYISEWKQGANRRDLIYLLSFILLYTAFIVTGLVRAEIARTNMYLFPLIVLFTALGYRRLTENKWLAITLLLLVMISNLFLIQQVFHLNIGHPMLKL